MEEQVKQVIANVLGISITELKEYDSVKTIEQWDSLKHITLIVALEDKFNVKFKEQEIPELNSVQLLLKKICP